MTLWRFITGALLLADIVALFMAAAVHARRIDAPPKSAKDQQIVRFLKTPKPLPAFSVQDLDGRTISSDQWRGTITIVNFWATWCPPCRAEIPELVALQQKYRDQLQIIGISEDEGSPEQVKQFVVEHMINYPVVMATPEIERIFSGVSALPTSFFVDRDLLVVQKHLGVLN